MSLTLVGWLCDVHHSLMPDMSGHWSFYVDPGTRAFTHGGGSKKPAKECLMSLCKGFAMAQAKGNNNFTQTP
jgi:hypothetical protein